MWSLERKAPTYFQVDREERLNAYPYISLGWAHMPFSWFSYEETNVSNHYYFVLVVRKTVFGICDHVRLKQTCSATDTS